MQKATSLPRLAALLLSAAALVAGCASGAKRPKPEPLPPDPALLSIGQAWHTSLPRIGFPLQIHVIDHRVSLAATNGTVVTLDANTGAELMRVRAGGNLSAGVGSDGDVSAVVSRDNEVVVLAGGDVRWQKPLETSSYTPPLVAGGRVFVLGADHSVTAFDRGSGATLWHFKRPSESLVLRQAGVLLPMGNVLVAGLGGRLAGIDPDQGQLLWETPLASARGTNDVESLIDLIGPAARQGSTLCARAFQAGVGCVDTNTSQLLWKRSTKGATNVAADGDLVFGVDSTGRVMAWSQAAGERAWQNDTLRWRELSGPVVAGSAVVLADAAGNVFWLSRTDGQLLARMTTNRSGVAATPVVAHDTVIVATHSGAIYGFVSR